MREVALRLTLLAGQIIVGKSIVSQAACLAHLLEYDSVHAAAEILVEERHGGCLVEVGGTALVVEHTHVDVLCVVRRNQHFRLGRQLRHVRFALGNGQELLGHSMHLLHHLGQCLLRQRAVVANAVLVVGKILQQVEQFLRFGFAQLSFAHYVASSVACTVHAVLEQRAEALALVLLVVLTVLEYQCHALCVSLFVGLRIGEQALEQRQRSLHILAQTRENDIHMVGTDGYIVRAGQFVELLLHFGSRHFRCADVFEILRSHVVAVVILVAEFVAEGQREEVVLHILLIDDGQTVCNGEMRKVLLEIEELRLNGLHLGLLNGFHKVAHLVAVRGNRRDGRFVYLLLCLIHALTLVNGHVAVGKEAVGKGYEFVLRDGGEAVERLHLLLPLDAVDEGVEHLADTSAVVVQRTQFREFVVIDGRYEQIFREISLLQFLYLAQHQVFHLLERLSFLRHAEEQEESVVLHAFHFTSGLHHLHLLVQVEVEEAGLSVR